MSAPNMLKLIFTELYIKKKKHAFNKKKKLKGIILSI